MYITILNYSTYQDPKNYETNNESNKKPTRNEQTQDTINKNDKNEEECERGTSSTIEFYSKDFLQFYEMYGYEGNISECHVIWQRIDYMNQLLILKRLPAYLDKTSTDRNSKLIFRMYPENYLKKQEWKKREYETKGVKESESLKQLKEALNG